MQDNNKSSRSIFSSIFRSSTISSTNPKGDIRGQYDRDYEGTGFLTARDQANANQLVSSLRNYGNMNDIGVIYSEYDEMETEVIIGSALKLYADDATTTDPTQKRAVWIKSDDNDLAKELVQVMDNFEIEDKAWSIIFNIAKYGDYYLEAMYNDRGYLVGVKQLSKPEDIMHIVVDTNESGYIIKRDPRLVHTNREGMFHDYDFYSEPAYIHFYTTDSPRMSDVVVSVVSDDGQFEDLVLDVTRGRSVLEPVRMNFRILRLLEDTLVTNKIARAEYIRILNVEVGAADGRKTSSLVTRVKNMFDAKPRYDSSQGSYGSDKVYRPSADLVVNATHQGVNALTLNEVGGDIETKDMADVEYFRNKLFAGLGIPKAFMGFEESISSGSIGDGSGTLAKLDIRYSRSVRRIQRSFISGMEDLLTLYLLSRGRVYDAENFEVVMNNPSSADEIARLDEVSKRVDLISQIMDSVANITQDTANLPELYLSLVETFVDDNQLHEVFSETLNRSIALNYLNLNTSVAQSRVEMMDANTDLISKVNTLEESYNDSISDPDDMSSDPLSNDDDDFTPGFSGGGFSSGGFSSGFDDFDDDLSDDLDIEDYDAPDLEDMTDDPDVLFDDTDFGMDLDAESGPEVQSLSPIDKLGLRRVLEDLGNISNHGPTKVIRNKAQELLISASGGYAQEVSDDIDNLYKSLESHYRAVSDFSNEEIVTINESMTSRDKVKRRKSIHKLLTKGGNAHE